MILKSLVVIILVILAIKFVCYRFSNPDKTETELFLDLITGKAFKLTAEGSKDLD